jgi:hypothetical protein
MTSELFDCVDFMVVVTRSFTLEFIKVVAAPVTSFSEVPIIIMLRIVIVKPSTVVAIIVSSGKVVALLAPCDVFSNQFLHVVGIGVIFGGSEELGDHARPLAK